MAREKILITCLKTGKTFKVVGQPSSPICLKRVGSDLSGRVQTHFFINGIVQFKSKMGLAPVLLWKKKNPLLIFTFLKPSLHCIFNFLNHYYCLIVYVSSNQRNSL